MTPETGRVWYLTNPEGKVIGASARSDLLAIDDAEGVIPRGDYLALVNEAFDRPEKDEYYTVRGYVLALGEVRMDTTNHTGEG